MAARSVHLGIVEAPGAMALADGKNGRPGLRADRRGCEGRKFPVAADARALGTAASAHSSSHVRAYPRSALVAALLDLTRRVEGGARNNRRIDSAHARHSGNWAMASRHSENWAVASRHSENWAAASRRRIGEAAARHASETLGFLHAL